MTRIYDYFKKNIEWICILTIIFAFISPILFTRNWLNIDFLNTGQIGDTVGGLVSPFLNLLSIILLYLTLREQTEGGRKTKDFDTLTKMLDSTKADFENLNFFPNKGSFEFYKGTRALFGMANTIKYSNDISLDIDDSSIKSFQLSFTLFISNLAKTLQKNYSSSIDLEDKKDFYETLKYYKTPIIMICVLCEDYYKRRKPNITELDKTIGMLALVKKALETEYEKYEPK